MMTKSNAAAQVGTTADLSRRPNPWPDRVSQDSADSFPASDPPSWSPLRVGSPVHDARSRPKEP